MLPENIAVHEISFIADLPKISRLPENCLRQFHHFSIKRKIHSLKPLK
jgi:hypothetical protein